VRAVAKLIRGKTVGEAFDKLSKRQQSRLLPPNAIERVRLEYDPETVTAQCTLDPDALGAFVQFNCVPHFLDLGELSAALDAFAEADVLAASGARIGQGIWSGQSFPGDYVASLNARAVAANCTKRAELGMRPVEKPAQFDLVRRVAAERARQHEVYRGPNCLHLGSVVHTEYWPLGSRIAENSVAGGGVISLDTAHDQAADKVADSDGIEEFD